MPARTSSKNRAVNAWILVLSLVPVAGFAQDGEAPKRPQFREPPVAQAAALEAMADSEAPVVALRAQRQLEDDTLCLTYNQERPGPTIYMDPNGTHRVYLENHLKPFTAAELVQFDPPVLMPGEPQEVADFLAATSGVTNLHTHGLHVSPRGRSDNVLLKINPKRSNLYTLSLPANHAPGTHWYHAHLHGSTALQVQGGMSGALIVRPPDGQSLNPRGFPVTEHVMVVQVDCSAPPSEPAVTLAETLGQLRSALAAESMPERLQSVAGAETDQDLAARIDALSEEDLRTLAKSLGKLPVKPPRFILNRLLNPTLEVSTGTFQRLRVVNSGSRRDDYKDVWIEGHDLYLAAFDGVNLTHLPKDGSGRYVAYNKDNPLVLAPGNRVDAYFLPSAVGEHALTMRGQARIRLTTETELVEPFTQELLTFQVSAQAKEEAESQAEESAESDLDRFLKALDANLMRLQSTTPYQTYLRPFGRAPSVQRDMEFNIVGSGRTRTFTINGRDYNAMVNGGMQGHVDYLGKEKRDGGRGPEGQTPWPPRTATEEVWTLTNPSSQPHPFHIHVSPFWVYDIRENGVSVRETNPNDPRINRWQDTITIPPNGGSVTIWHRFSEFEGIFVVHCHILQHEDRGMMINIMLVPRDNRDPAGYFKKEMAANCKINNEINGTTTDCSVQHE